MLNAFAAAKARAARQATSKIVEFVNAADHTARVSSAVPLHRPLFEAVPAEVWIDEYTPFHAVAVKLTFRNCDVVARRLKIEPVQSPFFKVLPCGKPLDKVDGKVAAGMETAFMLEFCPQQIDEYAIALVCCTERERFLLPVRVRGRYAALDIPDSISFGLCPVRLPTAKALTVRNVGARGAKFAFRLSDDDVFAISPVSATLEQDQAVQIELRMTPPSLLVTRGTLEIIDDSGTTAVVELSGTVENVDVYLSQPLVEPSATYLSLSSRKTIKICNESEFTLDFSWKSFADAAGDEQERDRLLEQLARVKALELEQLRQDALDGEQSVSLSPSPFDARKTLETKYKHLRKAAMEETMQFVDDCFAVTPLKGRVWAHFEMDVVVSFTPETEMLYSSTAFLEIAGQERRLPLQIRGQGIGPKAKVVYNELLDFGDVFISDERTRDFTIQNKSEIPVIFHLVPIQVEPRYTMQVTPETGTLEMNEMRKIEVTFCSQQLGEVSQMIRFGLNGSSDLLVVRFKANVIPPVFHFDTELVDFGQVSYSFAQSRTLKLINASKIAMKYSLRIPEEANYKHKEMELVPSQGKLSAYGEEEICVNFTPMHVKAYEYQLVVGVTGVGTDLLSIPLRAHSLVPEVVIEHPDLDFGQCFLRYPHKQTLVIENRSSNLFGRYEIGEQDDHSRAIATYNASEFSGVVPPGDKVQVALHLSCEKVGNIRLPMTVNVPGSTDLPLAVTLTATGCGPKVELDQPEIYWGNCACLVDHERVLRVTKASLIPAAYKTFIKNARSKFQVDKKEGLLMPGESVDMVVTANLDDTVLFKDQLYILIAEGDNLVVPLSIKGTGTTMWSPSELRVVDFGHQMTHRVCEWSCTLENKGKRVQVLTWINKAAAVASRAQAGGAEASSSKKAGVSTGSRSNNNAGKYDRNATSTGNQESSGSDNAVPMFSVFPGTIELKPRTACVFVFKGLSSAAGFIQEDLVCETRVGKGKVSRVAFVTQIRGVFVDPKLEASSPSLTFEYIHRPGNEIVRQSQPLTLTNVCELPLSFTLRTLTPFSLDCWEATLQPREQVEFNVEFYPGYKEDYTCRVINGKVLVVFTEHPQKDSVELVGDISFPNLSFESTKMDFGCTLNDTQKAVSMTITNVSKVDTSFRWVFIDDEKETPSGKKPPIPINQMFDILPIHGLLKPTESEKVEFIHYGHANRKFRSVVACEVDGGPEYEITLLGEASSLVYKLDKQSLDFGQVLFNKLEDRDFSILNVCKVPFAFNITAERISRGRLVEVTPTSGRVAPGEKARVMVRLRPGIPEPFEETLVLEIAHFQPFEFKIFGLGTFSSVTFNLPRENHPSSTVEGAAPNWIALKKRARKFIELSTLKAIDVESAAVKGLPLTGVESKSSIGTTATRAVDKASSAVSVPSSSTGKLAPSSFGSPPVSPSRTAARQVGGALVIDEVDIETEACRLFFSEYLVAQETKKSDSAARKALSAADSPADPASPPEPTKSPATAPAEAVTVANRARSSRRREPQAFAFVLSQFVLDFGNIVLGTHKVKKFSITNVGQVPVSFQLDKNLASSSGFQIEPERVVRLPEKQAVEFAVTFQARKNIEMGFYEVQLPVTVKNGPPCLLTMRATVTMPDISISADTLDFGRTVVGTCHTIFTQLQNVSAVTADWAFKKPMGSARDVANFRFTPQSGVLTPGNKVNVRIEFVPDDGRHFMLKLPIKVASNPKTRSIVCRGEGAELRLAFQPQLVDLDPVLPCDPPVRQAVAIMNDSDYPVEVFSLDFDPTYKEDEELLRAVDAYNPEGLLQLPVRTPGQSMKAYIGGNGLLPVENTETALVEQKTPSELDEESSLPHDAPNEPNQLDDTAASTSRSTDSALPVFRRSPSVVDYILLGPPRCGKSTQALLLAEKENLCVWSIDEAICAACVGESELGRAIRRALGIREEATLQQEQEQQLSTIALSAASNSASSLPKNPESTQENEAEPELSATPNAQELETLLPAIVTWRLNQSDMQRGSVLDGLESVFAPFETALAACSKAFAATRVVLLNFDEDAYDAMLAAASDKTAIARIALNGRASPHTRSKESLRSAQSRESFGRESNQLLRNDSEQSTGSGQGVAQTASGEDLSGDGGVNDATVDNNAVSPADTVKDPPAVSSVSEQFAALLRLKRGNSSEYPSFVEYAQSLEERRRLLVGSSLPEDSKRSDLDPGDAGVEEGRAEEAPGDQTRDRDAGFKDALMVEIPVIEIGEPLFIHNLVYAAIEKRVRELESQNLAVPAPATYQLIRRPPERFPRKSVPCFSIAAVLPPPSETAKETMDTADQGAPAPPTGPGLRLQVGLQRNHVLRRRASRVIEHRRVQMTQWIRTKKSRQRGGPVLRRLLATAG